MAKHMFKQLIDAVAYLHSLGIVHRDIKMENIMFTLSGQLKLSDFGLSRHFSPELIFSEKHLITGQSGTPAYLAPEQLDDKPYDPFVSEIWQLGIVLYAMLFGHIPFQSRNKEELLMQITTGKIKFNKDSVSKESMQLLKKLLERNPAKRITLPQIMNHPWLMHIKDCQNQVFTMSD